MPRERVKFAVGRLVDVEASYVGGDLMLLPLVGRDNKIQQVAFLPEMGRWRIPRRESYRFHSLGNIFRQARKKDGDVGWAGEVVLGRRLMAISSSAGFGSRSHFLENRETRKDTLDCISTVAGSANELPHPDDMHPSFPLRVWIFYQTDFRVLAQAGNLADGQEVINSLASMLEVAACILEGCGKVDDGLSNVVDLLVRRDLGSWLVGPRYRWRNQSSNHYWKLVRGVREQDSKG